MAYQWITWLDDALRDAGCTVAADCGDWSHRGRPSSSGQFAPYGVLWHHTGATASASNPFPSKNTLINGRPDLSGPLCHVGIDYNGVCHLIAAGRANHAGSARATGPMPSGDGNAMYVGFEIEYDGTQKMSTAQYEAAVLAAAGVLDHLNRSEAYARGHKESSSEGKWDPGGYSMDTMRSDTAARMGGDMPLTDDDIRRIWAYPNTVDGKQYSMGELMRWTYVEARDGAKNTWEWATTSPVDGTKQTALTILRWAYGEASKAAAKVTGSDTRSKDETIGKP